MHTIYVFICVLLVGIVFGIIGTVLFGYRMEVKLQSESDKAVINRLAFRKLASNPNLTWAEAVAAAEHDLYN